MTALKLNLNLEDESLFTANFLKRKKKCEKSEFPFFKVLIDQCWKVSKVTFAFLTKTKTKDF